MTGSIIEVAVPVELDPVAREKEMDSMSTITVIVILAVVTMTFGSMIGVFLYRSAAPKFWGPLQIPAILWITTGLLIASSFTFEAARRKLVLDDDQLGFHSLMRWTVGLAVAFLLGQVLGGFQLLHSGLVLARNPHSWFIFLFSGLHGLHIIAGLAGLGYLLLRTRERATGPKYTMRTRVVAKGVGICWHYLDFLWVVLFVLLVTWKR